MFIENSDEPYAYEIAKAIVARIEQIIRLKQLLI